MMRNPWLMKRHSRSYHQEKHLVWLHRPEKRLVRRHHQKEPFQSLRPSHYRLVNCLRLNLRRPSLHLVSYFRHPVSYLRRLNLLLVYYRNLHQIRHLQNRHLVSYLRLLTSCCYRLSLRLDCLHWNRHLLKSRHRRVCCRYQERCCYRLNRPLTHRRRRIHLHWVGFRRRCCYPLLVLWVPLYPKLRCFRWFLL